MLRLRNFQALLLLCLLVPLAGVAEPPIKVVYHVDFDDRQHQLSALQMMQNHINAAKPRRLDLIVVLHGNGISMLLEPDSLSRVRGFRRANADQLLSAQVDELRDQGVQFRVCSTTMATRHVDFERDLYHVYPGDVVNNGLHELVLLQMQGYTYIKP